MLMEAIDYGNPITASALNDGLVSWWIGLPDLAGGTNLLDIGPAQNHAAFTNMDPATDWWADPQFHPAVSVETDGSNDYLAASRDPLSGLTSFSLCAWIRELTGNGNYDGFCGTQSGYTSAGFSFWVRPSVYYVKINGASEINIGSVGGDNVWTHWCITYDGGTLKSYRNTVQVANSSIGSQTLPNGAIKFGVNYGGNYFAGRFTDVRIFNNAISQDHVRAIYTDSLCSWRETIRRQRKWFYLADAPAVATGNRRRRLLIAGTR